jgi:WhiB family transcriptional regulator, redox-sensing transcriptional regulator
MSPCWARIAMVGVCPIRVLARRNLKFPLRRADAPGHDHTVVITGVVRDHREAPETPHQRWNRTMHTWVGRERSDMPHAAADEPVEPSWQDYANCLGVDPDLFFPERGASTREAKEVCRGCVVREDCLEYALANGEKFGIWGGMSERERRRIRRQRALARAAANVG